MKGACPFTFLCIRLSRFIKFLKEVGLIIQRGAQIQINNGSPFPVLGLIEGQTNCFKNRSEKLFAFSRAFEKIYKLFFQAVILEFRHDIPPKRSPTQAVISAFGMVIWVISRFPGMEIEAEYI